ncbi:MAG TPA: hypothetical protein VEU96_16625, partial [Bryobacteraceae bacterium]|nr:hypothetical protein [Bryobacteraceae bacterium]
YSVSPGILEDFASRKFRVQDYNLMVTILKLGMQKLVIQNGMVRTKLTFHIDTTAISASSSTDVSSQSQSVGARAGFSWGGFGASGSYSSSIYRVHVVNETSSAATNLSIDILGEVQINFRTETFPTIDPTLVPKP